MPQFNLLYSNLHLSLHVFSFHFNLFSSVFQFVYQFDYLPSLCLLFVFFVHVFISFASFRLAITYLPLFSADMFLSFFYFLIEIISSMFQLFINSPFSTSSVFFHLCLYLIISLFFLSCCQTFPRFPFLMSLKK